MHKKPFVITLFLLFIPFILTDAQKLTNSPYSRFNFGSLNAAGSFRSLSMGGTGIAMRDNSSIYFCNPASYSSLDTTSFVFNFGTDVGFTSLLDGKNTFKSADMNFNHLLMGFPVSRNWGIATGVIPISNGYYYISDAISAEDPEYDPVTGEYASVHKGSGSIAKFFIGTGLSVTRNLSAGVNLSAVFGELKRMNQYEFADYEDTFNQRNSELFRIHGLSFDYGIQYSITLKNDRFITAGVSAGFAGNINSSLERLDERFSIYTVIPFSPDTLNYISNQSSDSTRLPGTLKFGVMFGKKDKFVVEFDYISSRWSEARIYGANTPMANTNSFRLGAEFIPEKYSNTSFLRRIEYRAGAHYADNYLVINGVQTREYGLSCGIAIRMRNTLSRATLFFDYTRKEGELSKGLHHENVYTVGTSLNLYDFWFIKKKYY